MLTLALMQMSMKNVEEKNSTEVTHKGRNISVWRSGSNSRRPYPRNSSLKPLLIHGNLEYQQCSPKQFKEAPTQDSSLDRFFEWAKEPFQGNNSQVKWFEMEGDLLVRRYKRPEDGIWLRQVLGKEIDLQQWDTLVFKGEHAENEHWRLVEDRYGQVGYAPAAFLVVILDTTAEEEESDATKKGQENSTEDNQIGGRIGQEGERRKSYSAAVIDGIKRNTTIYVGDSIIRKTDSRLSKGEDVVVCLPGARIEHVTERVEKIIGRGKGGTILVHVGTNNTDKEGTTAIVEKYRELLKKTKQARLGHIILSGILPVCGNRIQGYRNSKRMAVNGMVERLCKEEDVGYVDMWDSFVGNEELYFRDGLHLSGKGAAVLAEGLSGAVASGLGKVRYLN